jgi:hypothetical protein
MEKKLFWISFLSNTLNHNNEHDINICVYVPVGITEKQAKDLEENYDKYVEAWGTENDGDYSEFSYHDAIRDTFFEIGVQYEYPKADYTIYV